MTQFNRGPASKDHTVKDCDISESVPECRPTWSHLSSPPLVHRSEPATCTQVELSPRGFHAAANHPPPPPAEGSFSTMLQVWVAEFDCERS